MFEQGQGADVTLGGTPPQPHRGTLTPLIPLSLRASSSILGRRKGWIPARGAGMTGGWEEMSPLYVNGIREGGLFRPVDGGLAGQEGAQPRD